MIKYKDFLDRVLFALSVPKCVCCGERLNYGEKAFCPKCSANFKDFATRNCPRCSRILNSCRCTTPYLRSHFVGRVIKCYRYINRGSLSAANSLIFSLKRDNRADVLELCVDILSEAISNSVSDPQNYIFTNVPRRRSAIIEFGIDHSATLSKEVASRLGGEYLDLLKSNAKKPQKSLETLERLKNADFELTAEPDLSGKRVIIVDDIITSGASMSSAATLIRSLGCKNITAAVLAIAYKDK